MKNHAKLMLYLALIFVTFVTLHAENQYSLYNELPENTLAVVHWPNIPESLTALEKTSLYQIYTEPEVQTFLNSILAAVQPQIDKGLSDFQRQSGFTVDEVLSIFQGEVTIALVGVDPEKELLDAAISIEFGENGTVVRRLLEFAQQVSRITLTNSTYNDVSIFTVNQAPPHMKVSYAVVGNSIVIASRLELLQELLSQNQPKLKDSKLFQTALAKVQPEGCTPSKMLFVNIEKALQLFTPMIPQDVQAIAGKLGGMDVKSLSIGANTYHEQINWNIFVDCGGNKGLFSLLDFGPASLDCLEKIPYNSIGFSAVHFDYNQFLQKIEVILNDLDPSGRLLQQYREGENQLNQMLGFSFRDDLLNSLGSDTYSFGYMPEEGGLVPKSLSVTQLKDTEKFWQTTKKACEKVNLDLKEMDVDGTTVHYFSTPLGEFGKDPFSKLDREPNPVKVFAESISMGFSGISFFVENDHLYVASNMLDAKHYLKNRDKWQGSIASHPDFSKIKHTIPQGSSLFMYTDFRTLFNGVWNTLIPLFRSFDGVMRGMGVPFDSALLPRANTISRHLTPGTLSYKVDKEGIYLTAYGTIEITMPLVGAAIVGITAAVAIPALLKAKVAANESSTIATLRSIYTSQVLFQSSCVLDRNSNGLGEYGFLQEMSGSVPLRGTDIKVDPSFLSPSYEFVNGMLHKNGYYYYCYLPGNENAVGENDLEKDAESDPQEYAHLQEMHFVIYAWPIDGSNGRRAFAINEAGDIIQTSYHSYGKWSTPQANGAYKEGSDSNNLQDSFAFDSYGHDGNYWSRLYR